MNFGPYAIIDTVEHHFEKKPEWVWKIKPPTSGDELEMSRFVVQNRIVTGMDGVRREIPPTNLEIAHREIALTFAGTNLEDDGKTILEADATVEEVEAVLRDMPHEMVMEIWGAVGQACPTWGPALQKSKSPNK